MVTNVLGGLEKQKEESVLPKIGNGRKALASPSPGLLGESDVPES